MFVVFFFFWIKIIKLNYSLIPFFFQNKFDIGKYVKPSCTGQEGIKYTSILINVFCKVASQQNNSSNRKIVCAVSPQNKALFLSWRNSKLSHKSLGIYNLICSWFERLYRSWFSSLFFFCVSHKTLPNIQHFWNILSENVCRTRKAFNRGLKFFSLSSYRSRMMIGCHFIHSWKSS